MQEGLTMVRCLAVICLMLVSAAPQSVLFTESFDDPALVKRGWYDGNGYRIARDGVRGGCVEFEWKAGDTQAGPVRVGRHLFEPADEVFIRFYLRLEKDFGFSGKPFHPHLVHFMTTESTKYQGPAATRMTTYVEPVNGRLRLALQDIQNKDAPHGLTQGPLRGGYNGRTFDSKDKLFTGDDQWHCIEAQFKLNTLDLKADKPNEDGIVRAWFDGRLVVEDTKVVFRTTDWPGMKFNQFLMAPYFGPGLLPKAQKLWIDELVVSRERVGPLPPP